MADGGFRGRGGQRGRGRWERDHGGRGRREGGRRNEEAANNGMNQDGRSHDASRKRTMGYMRLQALRSQEPSEILQILANPRNGFKELLSSNTLKSDWVSSILGLLSSACECQATPQSLIVLLNMLRNSTFLSVHLTQYVVRITTEQSVAKQETFREPLKEACRIFTCLMEKLPNSCEQVMPVVLTMEYVTRTLRTASSVVDRELEELLQEVSSIAKELQERPIRDNKSDHPEQTEINPDLLTPPNNFREIGIFPDRRDIHLDKKPFLRANKQRGKFQDLEHYLDIQYRLMREDFVAPLRDGITEYLDQKIQGGPAKKLQNIRLYFDVHILNPVCNPAGVMHHIRFDVKRLQNVRWQSTKRLIYGSLVCLSKDDFRNMLFATVCNRDPKKLAEGEVDIRFEHNHEAVATIGPNETFIMAETSAYFESYRHVLKGLQDIKEDEFPFQKYIVRCQPKVMPPRYLIGNEVIYMDMQPLIDEDAKRVVYQRQPHLDVPIGIALDVEDEDHSTSSEDEEAIEYNFSQKAQLAKRVPVLNTLKWPDAESLHVDESQYCALQTALTKEVAIIQGPPGTGKTYVGWKIVRALLYNRQLWCPSQQENTPLLVVCYTNHALDQFLEGIQKFHDRNMVRVGGRSKSNSLEKYLLKNLRQQIRQDRNVPKAVFEGKMGVKFELDRLQANIDQIVAKIEATERGILHEDVVHGVMDDKHYEDLTENTRIPSSAELFVTRDKHQPSILIDWLGLGNVMYQEGPEEDFGQGGYEVRDDEEEGVDDEEEDEETVDVEEEAVTLQDQRKLDEDTEDPRYGRQRRLEEEARRRDRERADADLAFNIENMHLYEHDETDGNGFFQYDKRGKKRQRAKIKSGLRSSDSMTENDEGKVRNIWALNPTDRWRLYRLWMIRYRQQLKATIQDEEQAYQRACERLQEVKNQEDLAIMKRCDVLGMTTTGAARYRSVLQQIKPRIVVVEEAAEVLEAHIVSSLSNGCQHLVLIGDHKQLRPTPTVYRLAKEFSLDISLFERMVNNGMNCVTLEYQHRMRPMISTLMQPIYPALKDHESVLQCDDIKGIEPNIFFIDHKKYEIHDEELKSHSNDHEAAYIAALCKYLLLQGYSPSQITILTTYMGQIFKIRARMPKKVFEGVRICSVDNFQGEENDIVLLSLVRSSTKGTIGFLNVDNRVCVSLSRAKKGFYVIGNFTWLVQHSQLWSKVVSIMRKQGSMGPGLQLYCQNHPSTGRILAKDVKDFEKAPEGGCLLPCETRLKCGHVCVRACHTYDRDHSAYKCMKKCARVNCEKKHPCNRLCYQDCGDCMVQVEKIMPACGHKQMLPCFKNPYLAKCTAPCKESLNCGHKCRALCGEKHTVNCKEPYQRIWPCGHAVKALCYQKPERYPCPKPCNVTLECLHKCSGTCGKCRQGRLHSACSEDCGRTLVCGHACKEPCTKDCPPCREKCQNRCVHSRCPRPCGDPCDPCTEPCTWQCSHYKCTMLCSQPCNRLPCDRPCRQLLKCGHACIGLCGEPCPNKCRVCNKQEVEEIFFGTEEEPDSCFVQLEDCSHILEATGLDQWMKVKQDQQTQSIQLKVCPKCRTPIRKSRRYGSVVNEQLADIERVKMEILGHPSERKAKGTHLIKEVRQLKISDHEAYGDVLVRLEEDHVSQDDLLLIENQIIFLQHLAMLRQKHTREKSGIRDSPYEKHMGIVVDELADLRKWLLIPRPRISDQQLREFSQEVQRVSLLQKVAILANKCHHQKDYMKESETYLHKLKPVLDMLCCGKPLTDDQEVRIKETYERVKKDVGMVTGLGVSEKEKAIIVNVMKGHGINKGHWYKCPNDHIYAIGDCGRATEESKCPDCKATIGGQRHRLREDNRVASEMDGAQHPAFSEQANLDNYGFEARF